MSVYPEGKRFVAELSIKGVRHKRRFQTPHRGAALGTT